MKLTAHEYLRRSGGFMGGRWAVAPPRRAPRDPSSKRNYDFIQTLYFIFFPIIFLPHARKFIFNSVICIYRAFQSVCHLGLFPEIRHCFVVVELTKKRQEEKTFSSKEGKYINPETIFLILNFRKNYNLFRFLKSLL